MAGIFDSGIFKAGIFDQAASSSCIFDTGIFDQGIFDHCPDAQPQCLFDSGIFDIGIFDHCPDAGVTPTPKPPVYGSGDWRKRPAPIWSEVSWFKKKKKPKKEELVEEVAEVVEQAIPAITEDESRIVAQRIVSQVSYAQLRQINSLEAFIARVEAELAEMDDEEVLLLAA